MFSKNYHVLLLIALSTFLFFFKLNHTFLTNWDEAWYAAISRNISKTGDFISPEYNGRLWFAASPFYLWLTAIWFRLFGVSELGARFFSASLSVATVFIVYLIGKKISSNQTGFYAALILTTTIHFLYRGRTGNFDNSLAFFITLAVYSFLMGKESYIWYYLFTVATALAFLTKGILGLLPLPLMLLVPKRHILNSLAIFLAIVLPWHITAYFRHQNVFLKHYIFQYMFSKAIVVNPNSGTDFIWYLGTLKHGLKFWFPFLIPAILVVFMESRKNAKLRLILLWFLIPFIILTLARMRNDWYLIFLYPAAALIIGYFWDRIGKFTLQRLITFSILVLACINLILYRLSYVVPETVTAEVALSTKAKNLSKPEETILLDDNYLPVAVFYSDRRVIPLRFSRASDSLVSPESLKEATRGSARKIVLTNNETMNQLLASFNEVEYRILEAKDDKLLLELIF